MFTSELDLMIFVGWDELRAIRSEVEDLELSSYRILNSSKNYFSKDKHFRKFTRFLKILTYTRVSSIISFIYNIFI